MWHCNWCATRIRSLTCSADRLDGATRSHPHATQRTDCAQTGEKHCPRTPGVTRTRLTPLRTLKTACNPDIGDWVKDRAVLTRNLACVRQTAHPIVVVRARQQTRRVWQIKRYGKHSWRARWERGTGGGWLHPSCRRSSSRSACRRRALRQTQTDRQALKRQTRITTMMAQALIAGSVAPRIAGSTWTCLTDLSGAQTMGKRDSVNPAR